MTCCTSVHCSLHNLQCLKHSYDKEQYKYITFENCETKVKDKKQRWPCQQCHLNGMKYKIKSQSWKTAYCTVHILVVLVYVGYFGGWWGAAQHLYIPCIHAIWVPFWHHITARDRPLFPDSRIISLQQQAGERTVQARIWLSCNKHPCKTSYFPIFLIRFYCMQCTRVHASADSPLSTHNLHTVSQTLEHHSSVSGWSSDVTDAFFGPFLTLLLLISLFWGPKASVWVQHCSILVVLRGRDHHVGNLSASSRPWDSERESGS